MPIFVTDFAFAAETDAEISFGVGDAILVISRDSEWWYGELLDPSGGGTGKKGWFVPSYGHMANSICPYRDLSKKKKIIKRQEVAKNIFTDEQSFLGRLSEFIDAFVRPVLLLDTPFKRQLMADPSLGLTLTLLSDIHTVCTDFLNGIMTSESASAMADCYSQFSPSLQLFAQYTCENTKALNSLKSFTKQIDEFTKSSPIPGGLTVEYCLIMPLNHYTKYAPDLQEFVWLTPFDAPELPALEGALIGLAEQSKIVDEKNKEEEEAQRLLQLQFQFQGNPQIFKPNRRIVKVGELEKVRKDKTGQRYSEKMYFAHLFNDQLFYSVRNSLSGTFKLHKTINLDGAMLQKMKYPETDVLGPLECLFAITHHADGGGKGEQKVDLFRVDAQKDYTNWLSAIQRQIKHIEMEKNNAINNNRLSQRARGGGLSDKQINALGDRGRCIFQFLQKEQQYALSMEAFDHVVFQPLIDASKGAFLSPKLSKSQAQQITSELQAADIQITLRSAEGLSVGVKEFSSTLEKLCAAGVWQEDLSVGPLFSSAATKHLYSNYKSYSSKHLQSLRVLKGPHFVSFYREAEEMLTMLPGSFGEKFDVPRNRPLIYLQFVETLNQLTKDGHPDKAGMKQAVALTRQLVADVEDVVRAKKNFEKLLDIQASLVSPSMFGSEPIIENLASMTRSFLKEGDLKKVCRKANKSFRFWLFSDMFIYGISSGIASKTFTFHRALMLNAMTATKHSDPSLPHSIEILSTEKSFIVLAPSAQQMNEWVTKINTARMTLKERGGVLEEISVAPVWKPDSSNDDCRVCHESFGIFKRRHHCRRCGSLVCSTHSTNQLVLANIHATELQRVCDDCYQDHIKPRRKSIGQRSPDKSGSGWGGGQEDVAAAARFATAQAEAEEQTAEEEQEISRRLSSTSLGGGGSGSFKRGSGRIVAPPPKAERKPSLLPQGAPPPAPSSAAPSQLPPPLPTSAAPSILPPPVPKSQAPAMVSPPPRAAGVAPPAPKQLPSPAVAAPSPPKSAAAPPPPAGKKPPPPPMGTRAPSSSASKPAPPAPSKSGGGGSSSASAVPEHMMKFKKMQDMNIPDGAIRNKMVQDGMSGTDIENFFKGVFSAAPSAAGAPPPPPGPPSSSVGGLGAGTGGVPEHLQKWKKMQNLHIPDGAIRNKMVQEGISPTDIDNFFKGIYSAAGGAPAPPAPALRPAAPAISKPAGGPFGGGGGGGGFLSQIAGGAGTLKKASSSPAPPPAGGPFGGGGGGSMMDLIKGGVKLKKAVPTNSEPPKPKPVGGMMGELMAAMEKNRAQIATVDSEGESDSDSDGDFDC